MFTTNKHKMQQIHMFTTNKHKIQQIHICLQQINIRYNKYTYVYNI